MFSIALKQYKKTKIATRYWGDIIVFLLLVSGSLIIVFPFIFAVVISLDKAAAYNIPFPPSILPKQFTIQFFFLAIERLKLGRIYFNSFAVTGGVVLISVFSALISGYALSKIKFRGSKLVLFLCLITMMIPFEAILIPLFMFFNALGLINTYYVFYATAFAYPFGTFLAKQFIDTLPNSLRESARIDGAGEIRTFFEIYVPLTGTIMATMAILQFLGSWNNLLWPLIVLNNPKLYTMQIALALFKMTLDPGISVNSAVVYPGITMAGNILGLIPVLVVYLFLQKYIVQSIALSGIKQ